MITPFHISLFARPPKTRVCKFYGFAEISDAQASKTRKNKTGDDRQNRFTLALAIQCGDVYFKIYKFA